MATPRKKDRTAPDKTDIYTVAPGAARVESDSSNEPPKTEVCSPTEGEDIGATLAPEPALPPTLDGSPEPPKKPAKPAKPSPLRKPVEGYEILAELGRGGMGVVYKARQKNLNRVVALKMVIAGEYASPEACVRFLGEAEVVASLHHPNIIQVYEFGNHEGYPYFTLEYVAGGSLDQRLDGTPWPALEAAETVLTLTNAVRAAHKKGVVHRDLKPGNILMDSDGTLKITDFGLAKRVKGASGLTQTGSIVGTPSYMAPEQASGKARDVGLAADIYSLGAILYELVTGRPPFKAETPVDTIMHLLKEEPVPPGQLNAKCPRDLETICLKCLQKDSAKRYASAKDLAADLTRFRDGEPIRARPISRRERVQRWVKKRPAAAALIAVSLVAAIALLVVGWTYNLHLQTALTVAEQQRQKAEVAQKTAEDAQKTTDEQRVKAQDAQKTAEEERTKAVANATEAERQRQIAADNFGKRLDAIDDIILNIDGRLAMTPSLRALRLEFLNETKKFSDQLLADNPNDPRARRQAGRVERGVGELEFAAGNTIASAGAYHHARELQEALVKEYPNEVSYQSDLALTCSRQGVLYTSVRRYDDALQCYGRAIEVESDLYARNPQMSDFLGLSGYYRFQMANVLEEKGDLAGALLLYRKAFDQQTEVVDLAPRVTNHTRNRGATATSLGYALAHSKPIEAQLWLERALEDARTVYRGARMDAAARRNLTLAYHDLAAFYKWRGDHASLAKLGAGLAQDFPRVGGETYNAACFAATAIEVVQANPMLPADQRQQLLDDYGKQAAALLQQASEEGYTEREHMMIDADLDSLRPRADFKEFWAALDKRFPNKPVRPDRVLAALRDDYNDRRQTYDLLVRDAHTVADRKRAQVNKPSFDVVGRRMLELTEKGPDVPTSADALAWVLENAAAADDPKQATALQTRALELLEKDHLKKKDFGNICAVLARNPSPGVDRLLRAAVAANPDPDVRGLAAWALGMSLAMQADQAYERKQINADQLSQQAEEQLEKVIKDHGAIALDQGTVGQSARERLYRLRTLSPGRPARDLQGIALNGVTMRLADYKGKVVLLDYWANWCGFCRQMYPSERALATRMKDRPFALLGVNCDSDKAAAQRVVERERLDWPCWWDGQGELREQWQVDAFPTLYLIDHLGIIRKKWVGRPEPGEIEQAVEELVRAAEQGVSGQ